MILQLKCSGLIRILVPLVLVQPLYSEYRVDEETYATTSEIVDNMNDSFDSFRRTAVQIPLTTELEVVSAMFLLDLFKIPDKHELREIGIMDKFKQDFIKATYTVYLSALYYHSFLKCRLYNLAGPEMESLYPIDEKISSKCGSVLVHFKSPCYVFLNKVKNKDVQYFRNIRNDKSSHTFVRTILVLKDYIKILFDTMDRLEDSLPTAPGALDDTVEIKKIKRRAFASAHDLLLDKNNEKLRSVREYLKQYFAQINIDEGPIDLEGNFVDTSEVDIKSERVRSTIEVFIWRNGVQILEKHEEAIKKLYSDKSKSFETKAEYSKFSSSAEKLIKDEDYELINEETSAEDAWFLKTAEELNADRKRKEELQKEEETYNYADMHPFKMLKLGEEFRYGIFEIWQSKFGMIKSLPEPNSADFSDIKVMWNQEDQTKPDFAFKIKKIIFL